MGHLVSELLFSPSPMSVILFDGLNFCLSHFRFHHVNSYRSQNVLNKSCCINFIILESPPGISFFSLVYITRDEPFVSLSSSCIYYPLLSNVKRTEQIELCIFWQKTSLNFLLIFRLLHQQRWQTCATNFRDGVRISNWRCGRFLLCPKPLPDHMFLHPQAFV